MRMDANLTRILKPPVFPSGTNIPMQWTMLADWLPKQFPVDYEEFVRIYGSGLVDGFIVVFTPFSRIEGAQMAYRAGKILDLARRLRDPLYPFPLYPEPSGALPWGTTDNGDTLFWVTEGSPEQWTVRVSRSRSSEFADYPLGLTGFLAGILDGALRCSFFPADFPSSCPTFVALDSPE